MKSIEERAWEKYPGVIKHHNLAQIDINEEKRKMYIEIAKEQKAIDDAYFADASKIVIDKACEWLAENIDSRARFFEDGVWVQRSIAGDFRKAMEE